MHTKTIHEQGKTHGSNYAHILQRFCTKIGAKKDQNDSAFFDRFARFKNEIIRISRTKTKKLRADYFWVCLTEVPTNRPGGMREAIE